MIINIEEMANALDMNMKIFDNKVSVFRDKVNEFHE